MTQFYFHLRTATGLERDDIGLDLDGMERAYLDADAAIPAMSAELLREKANPYQHAFEIRDASDKLLMEVPFSEVLDEGKKPAPPNRRKRRHKAEAEMERTTHLIASIEDSRTALQATLVETKRLIAEAQKVRSSQSGR